jgi:hypothetical protein
MSGYNRRRRRAVVYSAIGYYPETNEVREVFESSSLTQIKKMVDREIDRDSRIVFSIEKGQRKGRGPFVLKKRLQSVAVRGRKKTRGRPKHRRVIKRTSIYDNPTYEE